MDGISLIICTYNGKDKMTKTLTAIKQLEAQFKWELLVVDNASTDGTGSLVKELLADATFDWQLLREDKPGLMHARLCGLHTAKYPILLYCDDDNALNRNYLQIGFKLIQEHPTIGALGGCGIPVFAAEKPKWFDQYSHSFAVGPQSDRDGFLNEYPAELYGAGTFFRKKPLLHFIEKNFKPVLSGRKGSTLASGEDVEWCYLIQLMGYKIYYDHRLTFFHEMPEGRMNWEYYLRLKEGIAAGAGKLLPYSCLLESKKMSALHYFGRWLKCSLISTLIYFKYKMKFFKKEIIEDDERLVKTILKSKMKSYINNAFIAYQHYKKLKKIL